MNGQSVSDASSSRPGGAGDHEIAQRLIRHAAHRVPAPLAERLEEEWLADLATRRGWMPRLMFALGCCWATNAIARDCRGLEVSARAAAAAGSKTMTVHAHPDLTFLSRRTTVLLTIVAVHAAVIYAFAMGLAQKLIEPQAAIKVDFLRDPPTKPIPPPLPRPNLAHPRMIDPLPIPLISVAEPGPDAIQAPVQPAVPDPTPALPPAPPVRRVMGGPGAGFPNSDDYYPADARRGGEQGSTAIEVCVDRNGKLTAEPRVMRSSGSARLDAGAIRLARAGSGHYRPTTENGAPVSSCYTYLIRFHLR